MSTPPAPPPLASLLAGPLVSVVCPMHNESATVALFFERLIPILEGLGVPFEVVCVNDGSTDNTWKLLLSASRHDTRIRALNLSRNFGKEAALSCGLDYALGRAVVPIDADLQDPPELIPQMMKLWQQGFDMVLPQRTDRFSDRWFKRKTAEWFYRIHNAISDSPIPPNVGDFRLLDRKVVDAVRSMPERRRFMKGLFAWVGYHQIIIPYRREPRAAGLSKFSGWRLWNFALEGFTSFSTAPLRIWTYLGLLIAAIAFAYGLFIIAYVIFGGEAVPGYASMITIVLFLGGIQLIGLGVLGEYLGRIYTETKQRPIYLLKQEGQDEP